MPEKIVQLPDGRIVQFPETMPDSTIAQLLSEGHASQPQQTQRSGPTAQQIFNQPVDTAISAFDQFGQGNFGAGGARLARAGLQFIPSVYGGATQGIRELGQASGVPIVNELAGGLANALEIPGHIIGGASNVVTGVADAVGKPLDNALGLQGNAYTDELGQFAREAVPYAVAPVLVKGTAAGARGATKSVAERPQRLATREIKRVAGPSSRETGYNQALQRSLPYIADQVRLNKIDLKQPESAFAQASEIVRESKNKLWRESVEPAIARHKDAPIPGDLIARSVSRSISSYLKELEPKKAEAAQKYADQFRGKIYTASQVHELIKGLNAQLKGVKGKTPEQRAAIEQVDPLNASREAALDAMQGALMRTLTERGETGVAQLRGDYGALSQVKAAIDRSTNKAEKADLVSLGDYVRRHGGIASAGLLGEMIARAMGLPPGVSMGAGAAAMTLTEMAKQRSKPNATISRAFNRLEKSKLQPPRFEPDLVSPRALLPPPLSSDPAFPSGGYSRAVPPQGFSPPPDVLRTNIPPYIHYGVAKPQKALPPAPIRLGGPGSTGDYPLDVSAGYFIRDANGKIIGKRFLDFEGPENLLGGKKK